MELPHPHPIPFFSRFVLVTKRSSPTSWILFPSSFVIYFHPSQSSSSRPSSMEYMGYVSHNFFQCSVSSEEVNFFPHLGRIYSPVLSPFHSLAAASKASTKSLPGSYPARFTASKIQRIASSSLSRSGANPPSSPTAVASPFSLKNAAKA